MESRPRITEQQRTDGATTRRSRTGGAPQRHRGALGASQALYRDLVERLPGAVYIAEFGRDGRWLFVTSGIEALTGYAADRWLEDPEFWWDRIHPEDREDVLMLEAQSRASGTRFIAEYRIVTQDDGIVWVRDDAAVVVSDGRPVLQGVMWDITPQKRAEEDIRSALAMEKEAGERLRDLNRLQNNFMAAVSHELRTPVSVILGGALTLQRALATLPRDEQQELVDSMVHRATRLSEVLADILDFEGLLGGAATLSRERVEVTELVRRLVDRLAPVSGHHRVEVVADPLVAELNPVIVERILENLLRNALRHTPTGTAVWVRVAGEREGVLLAVEDDGFGVVEEMKEAIFRPFRHGASAAAHDPGVGIGLSLVAEWAALHGGRAWVEDRPGGGASFRVFLPSP